MIVRKQSVFTGLMNEMDLNVTQEQLNEYAGSTRLVQDIFPHLKAEEREFLISGVTPAEWDAAFGKEETA